MKRQAAGYVGSIRSAVGAPDAPATVFEGRTQDWGGLLRRAGCLAGGLRRLRVEPGDRVAVLATNSDRYVELYLAIPWAGAVVAPLNPRWSPAENAYAIEDCKPKLILVGEGIAADSVQLAADLKDRLTPVWFSASPAPQGWLDYADLLEGPPIEDAGRQGEDLFGIFYTGGTTGRSKGVMLSHAGVVGNCRAMRASGLFPDGCRGLIVAPLFHLAAAAVMTSIMLAGGAAVILGGFTPGATLETIERERVTDALLVPTMMQMMLNDPAFSPRPLAGLKRIFYAASPINETTLDGMMAAAPQVDFYQGYGMTEVSCAATILGPEFHRGDHRKAGRHRSAGRAIEDTEIMIADPDGRPVPVGQVGEILIRGAGLMLGYLNKPDLSRDALRDGWMHTGDGGRVDDLGLVYVVDRLKDMIVTGGENVYSGEVESALARHPAVAQCAVIGVPDQRWGERVHAVIVPKPGADVTADDIVVHCRTLIAGYKCPRSVEVSTEALPLSAAGKVLKSILREQYWRGQHRNVA